MAIRLSGMVSGLDTESLVKEMMSAQNMKKTKVEGKITKLEWKKDKWKELNTKIYALYTGSLSKIKTQGSYQAKKVSTSNDAAATITAGNNAVEGSHSLEVKSLASAQYVTGAAISKDKNDADITINSTTKLKDLGVENTITIQSAKGPFTLDITDDTTVDNFLSKCKEAGLNASFDTNQKRFFISSKESGVENAFTIEGANLDKLGLGNGQVTTVNAADCEIIYNGATLTSSSNTISVNGVTISANAVTSTPINISVTKDTQKVYDMVKDFVKSYNELLKEMNECYYADSAKGYDVLTEEEEEAMTEDQVEKWNNKIKDSLLRRDSSLGGLLTSMKSALSSKVPVGGKELTLVNFGIHTTDYTEKGLLHIDGDPDDSAVSDKTDKLMKAIEEDPDAVMEALSGIASNLYSTMNEKMKSSSLSSALTYYNDKEIDKTMTRYKDELAKLEVRLQKIEDRYYNQFTAMETAMAKLNSQSSYFSQLSGGGQ